MSISIVPTYPGAGPAGRGPVLVAPGGRRGLGLKRIESAALVAVGVMVTFGAWWWATANVDTSSVDPVVPVMESVGSTEPDVVVVHVSGAVQHPGVVRLRRGARAIDAIEAAGGAGSDAVLADVNLAAEVVDGSQIRVPRRGDPGSTGTPVDDGLVVVNRADAAALEALPGVGPVLAERIIDHRDSHGPFTTPEDLLDVSGIGESILARLRPHIRIP